ncbi:MAG: hypothetical protein IID43_03155 [Planctomycetes bacterium]|nr:hypothetical protein [Planctomycetota bacterium]
MAVNTSILRRAYEAVALFAMLNVLVFGGATAYLVGSGIIDGEKLRSIAAVLRGENEATSQEEESEVAKQPDETEEAKRAGPTPGNSTMILQMNSEILRREAERVKVELDQRLALNNAIMLRITQERDAFRRERDAEAARKKAAIEEQKAVGFEKTIELYESLSPKVAIEYLLDISDPNESARVLLKMETRKAKKIIEAAKQAEQKGRMKDILKRLREVAPGRSDELARQGG